MKNIIVLLICLTSISALAQRTLEIVSDAMDAPFDQVESAGFLYVAENYAASLGRYDGSTVTNFAYPIRSGRQLLYRSYFPRQMVDFRSSVFLILFEDGESFTHVYRFNGTSFSRINFPGSILSNLVVFNERLYAVVESGASAKLYSYNGTTVSAVPDGSFPLPDHCEIQAGGNSLYINGWGSSSATFLTRFDGTTFNSVSDLPTHLGSLMNVIAMPGTEKVYFQFYFYNSIYFYDGTSLVESFSQPGHITPLMRWDNDVVFQAALYETELYICRDGSCREISAPTGSLINDAGAIALYRDDLYVSLRVGANDLVYRFDRTSFTPFFEFPENAISPVLKVREGLLLMVPKPANDNTAYEFDGTDFIEIRTPGEEWLYESKASNACVHGWSISYFDEAIHDYQWRFAVERPDSSCIPPPPGSGPVSVIPSRLSAYDRIEIGTGGRDRGWCWNEIIVDWEISPICPGLPKVPCEDPAFSVEFLDGKGKLILNKYFKNPFAFTVPLKDEQSYALHMGLLEMNKKSDILRYDSRLVAKGIENISLDLHPQDDYFFLTVNTEKETQVPFSITLRDTKGKALWQQNFIAPMDELVRAYVPTAGEYLELAYAGDFNKEVMLYPNPVAGTLFIDNPQQFIPVSMSLRDLNGKIILAERQVLSGVSEFDVSGYKPGLYILTITEGKTTHRQLIELR